MNLEQVAGAASQVSLAGIWTVAFILTMRSYLRFKLENMTRRDSAVLARAVRIERAFFAFSFIFLPSLMVWLPVIGLMSPEDQFFLPLVLTWLVILVFGSIHFHLGLRPARAAWIVAVGSSSPSSFEGEILKEKISGEELGRNV